jgi:hypothetical protein
MANDSSHEVRLLPSVLYPIDVAPYGLALPLRAWPANQPRHGVFRRTGSLPCSREVHPLTSFPPLQSLPDNTYNATTEVALLLAHPRRVRSCDHARRDSRPPPVPRAAPLLRSLAPSAPSVPGVLFSAYTHGDKSSFVQCRLPACLTCSLSASKVSHPLDGFLLPGPRRFVSPDRHPWGSEPCSVNGHDGRGACARLCRSFQHIRTSELIPTRETNNTSYPHHGLQGAVSSASPTIVPLGSTQ